MTKPAAVRIFDPMFAAMVPFLLVCFPIGRLTGMFRLSGPVCDQ
jgi:hypothetical protein